MLDELGLALALGFPHRHQNAWLGDPAEIVLDGRDLSGRDHVESDGLGESVGMAHPTRTLVPRLVNCVDGLTDAVRKECLAGGDIEADERLPKRVRFGWKTNGPCIVALVDRLGRCGIVEPGHLMSEARVLSLDLDAAL